MDILNMLHIGGWDSKTNITELLHFSAVKSCPADGCHIHLAGSLQTFDNVGRISAGADTNRNIPGIPQAEKLLRKHNLISGIIRPGREERHVGSQADQP